MTTLTVKGMHCKSCVMLIRDVLEEQGATTIKVQLDEKKQEGTVSFETLNEKKAIETIKEEGYEVKR